MLHVLLRHLMALAICKYDKILSMMAYKKFDLKHSGKQ